MELEEWTQKLKDAICIAVDIREESMNPSTGFYDKNTYQAATEACSSTAVDIPHLAPVVHILIVHDKAGALEWASR